MERKTVYPYGVKTITRVQSTSENDYVKDGELVVGAGARAVMVESSSDLDELEDYAPGSVAYTAGFADMWQLDSSGTWTAL